MLYFVARGSIEFTRGERVTAIIGLLTNIHLSLLVCLSACNKMCSLMALAVLSGIQLFSSSQQRCTRFVGGRRIAPQTKNTQLLFASQRTLLFLLHVCIYPSCALKFRYAIFATVA